MRIVHADAVEYFASSEESADVIMIDGCDKRGVAPAFCNENFYRTLRSRLRPGGMLVMNLIGPSHVMRAHLRHIEREFGGRHIVLELSTCSNQLVFAFNDPLFSPDWSAIRDSVDLLTLQYGLDFPYYFSKLRHACNFASRRLRRPRKTQDRRDAMND